VTFSNRPCFETTLRRLDLLLHREILRLRARYQLSLDEFRGLYISDNQIDHLAQEMPPDQPLEKSISELTAKAMHLAAAGSPELARDAAWSRLTGAFGLNLPEQDVLLLALAPELHPKYETIYAYLNDDVTRKYPTVNLALRLFQDPDGNSFRDTLSSSSRLFVEDLLQWRAEGPGPGALNAGFDITPAVRNFLLGLPPVAPELIHRSRQHPCAEPAWNRLHYAPALRSRLQGLSRLLQHREAIGPIVLEGEAGSGRRQIARDVLGSIGKSIIMADLNILDPDRQSLPAQARRLVTQARLTDAGLYLSGLDSLMASEPRERRDIKTVLLYLAEAPVVLFYALPPHQPWRAWLEEITVISLSINEPTPEQRGHLWRQALDHYRLDTRQTDRVAVVERFTLNAGQIDAAAASLRQERRLTPEGQKQISTKELFAAARDQSVGDIGRLAQKVPLLFGWEDLVLPRNTLRHLREVAAAITNRGLVYGQWDLQSRMGGVWGLMILFSGASGTGKTMSAGVIARAIGLDLYRIDLAGVVSKYIGETEKNLDRIFSAARRANCILFFDEADALFGKRTEIKDAHDRYANIEVAYLLQKMESHDGVVILATNIAKNLDQAFSRRMHYAVEFPRPNAEQRQRLWQGIFPSRTPLGEDVDFGFLARQFDATGGDIKTAALDAAMLAAAADRTVTMACLVKAMARQIVKQGQMPTATRFKQYFHMLNR